MFSSCIIVFFKASLSDKLKSRSEAMRYVKFLSEIKGCLKIHSENRGYVDSRGWFEVAEDRMQCRAFVLVNRISYKYNFDIILLPSLAKSLF
jgi:hypothetical protein